jgi:sulfide:quinone oxidoreductase
LETVLGLRELAGDRVSLTLLTPSEDFVYRPIAVVEPFLVQRRSPRHLSLVEFAGDVGAKLTPGRLVAVDWQRRLLSLEGSRQELSYDALVIAVGARTRGLWPVALNLSGADVGVSLRGLVEDIDRGLVRSLAFVVPSQTTWPLPAYELALLMRERAHENGLDVQITIFTAEDAPVAAFGREASAGVATTLSAAGIDILPGMSVEIPRAGEVSVHPGEASLRFDRVVAVPQLVGPAIDGLPSSADGFLPITPNAEVVGVERVYAAGDVTDFPVKQGGIAAEQADAAAGSIAALAGAPVQPHQIPTLCQGMLLCSRTGRYLYLRADLSGGVARGSSIGQVPTSSPAAKIAARYLGPYLDKRWSVPAPDKTNWHALSFLERFHDGETPS